MSFGLSFPCSVYIVIHKSITILFIMNLILSMSRSQTGVWERGKNLTVLARRVRFYIGKNRFI
jgi:hypothetical protein